MKYTGLFGMIACLLMAWPGWAEDAGRGKTLHDPSCLTSCHAAKAHGDARAFYTRKTRVQSLAKLKSQVSYCNQQVLNTEWWPDDEADVVAYLNGAFYRFGQAEGQGL